MQFIELNLSTAFVLLMSFGAFIMELSAYFVVQLCTPYCLSFISVLLAYYLYYTCTKFISVSY